MHALGLILLLCASVSGLPQPDAIGREVINKAYQAMVVSTQFHLTDVQRMNGMGYVGSAARIRRFIARLLTGEAIRMGVVGGSISVGQGAGGPSKTYAAHLLRYITKHFPNTQHMLYNAALPGTTSPYMSACLDQHMPSDADLVFVEYSLNDRSWPSHNFRDPERRAFERLLRKLLDMPNKPAVVLVHMYAACKERPCNKFWTNAERDYSELARYYGLPEISIKAGLYHDMMESNRELSLVLEGLTGDDVIRQHTGQGGLPTRKLASSRGLADQDQQIQSQLGQSQPALVQHQEQQSQANQDLRRAQPQGQQSSSQLSQNPVQQLEQQGQHPVQQQGQQGQNLVQQQEQQGQNLVQLQRCARAAHNFHVSSPWASAAWQWLANAMNGALHLASAGLTSHRHRRALLATQVKGAAPISSLQDPLRDPTTKAAAALVTGLGLEVPFLSHPHFYHGKVHPSTQGHLLCGELAIMLFMHVMSDMVQAEVDGPASPPSTPMDLTGNTTHPEQAAGSNGRFHGLHGAPLAYMLEEAVKELPEPLSPNNYAWPHSVCIMGQTFHQEVAVNNKGFTWRNESNKFGMIADEVGSWLDVLIRTQPPKAEDTLQVLVQIAMLQSYEHMGTALVSCISGCSCEPTIFQGWTKEKVSLVIMHNVKVTQSPHCRMRVMVQKQTDSPDRGHKVKVVGVVISEEVGSSSVAIYGRLRGSTTEKVHNQGIRISTGEMVQKDARANLH